MTTFKEQLKADEAVFLNQDEFADEIEWNGKRQWFDTETGAFKPIVAVIDKDDIGPMEEMGVFSEKFIVFISERCIDRPVPEEEISLNGKRYYVRSVDLEGGMLEIAIFRTRA